MAWLDSKFVIVSMRDPGEPQSPEMELFGEDFSKGKARIDYIVEDYFDC